MIGLNAFKAQMNSAKNAKHAGKKRKLTDEPVDEPSKDSCETLPVLPPAAKKARTSPGPLSSKSAAQKLVQQRKCDIVR